MVIQRTVASAIASACNAWRNCQSSGNTVWETKWSDLLDRLERTLPSGSGIDNGTKIDRDRTSADKIVLTCGFHHMNDGGFYDGWTEHTITIHPQFDGIAVAISGRNRNDIKDYLADVYQHALSEACDV